MIENHNNQETSIGIMILQIIKVAGKTKTKEIGIMIIEIVEVISINNLIEDHRANIINSRIIGIHNTNSNNNITMIL